MCELLLHIGYGTFKPVRCEHIEDHQMDPEYFEISEAAIASIRKYKAQGKKLVAVGSTTTRVLEQLVLEGELPPQGACGWCDLFIYPGFEFKILDGLITNFHLPRSTLFMLVCCEMDV